ncbi:hypothetical protein OEZ86_014736 [Tetradesmus obliquus]|nr:hypothetical protein OEZ86_014736 [Tetradesmus obliquus]
MGRHPAGTAACITLGTAVVLCITLGTAVVLCVACAILLAAAPPAQWRRPLLSPATAAARLPLTSAPLNTAPAATGNASRSFTISNDRFMKDGAPFRLLSGSVHYNRIPPDLWRDRLARARALGLNAVQFYVPWNFHQPRPGPEGLLPFEGWRDVAGFVRAAGEAGLLVLLRPGPYICGEWEFGGLPAWLLQANPAMPVRSADPAFLAAVEAWWGALLPQLAPLTYERGGPIIMVQVENEYGYFGGSKPYLRHLADTIRHHMGQQVLLYTVDGASLLPVAMGSLPGGDVLATVDFGPTTDVEAAFALQKSFNPPGRSPPFCVEYYTGWLTHWGEPMARSQAADVAGTLRDILAAANSSASVNLYMAAGGTNFGPWAGANVFGTPPGGLRQQQLPGPGPAQWRLQQAALQQHKQQQMQQQSRGSAGSSSSSRNQELYQPHITSYDYNCPIGEGGTVGQLGMGGDSKFDALRQVIAEAQGQYGQYYGPILYQTVLQGQQAAPAGGLLQLTAHDTVWAFLDGQLLGRSYRSAPSTIEGCSSSTSSQGRLLQLLVWPLGRNNFALFGSSMNDQKGLLGNVSLAGQVLTGWNVTHLCLEGGGPDAFSGLQLPWRPLAGAAAGAGGAGAHWDSDNSAGQQQASSGATGSQQQQQQRGSLLPPGRPADTFLHLGEGWGRGQVWVNGVSLGAYWAEQGPQMSLYLPGSFLQPGFNEVVLLELDGRVPVRGDGPPTIAGADEPDFNGPAAGPAPLA